MSKIANLKKNNHGLHHLVNATKYSLAGLKVLFKNEAAFRQELLLFSILTPVALFLPLSFLFKGYLISSGLIIVISEAFNTAIEYLTDHLFKEENPIAKNVKDIGSAAVMLSLINLAIAWGAALLMIFS